LNIKQLYAIDIDEAMIEFAKNTYPENNIEYLVQDISLEWDRLRPEVKELEGKASLIFTNFTLHWIRDKKNLAKNLFRLLSTDGLFYGNIQYLSDPFADLKGKQKEIQERVIKVPTLKQQFSLWQQVFRGVGFNTIHIQFADIEYIVEKRTFEKS